MKRKDALALAEVAGYHSDDAAVVRIYVENRVSLAAVKEAYRQGARKRAKGMPCNCSKCKEACTCRKCNPGQP